MAWILHKLSLLEKERLSGKAQRETLDLATSQRLMRTRIVNSCHA